jgi:hypothetical protein
LGLSFEVNRNGVRVFYRSVTFVLVERLLDSLCLLTGVPRKTKNGVVVVFGLV